MVLAPQWCVYLHLSLSPTPGYPQIETAPGCAVVTGFIPTSRLNTQQTFDVAVPGFTVGALVGLPSSCPPNPYPYLAKPIEVMAAEILNPSCTTSAPTELQVAAALRPTTAILCVSTNDVLLYLLIGMPPTDPTTFGSRYHIAATTMASASC